MFLNSIDFVIFLPIVFILYWFFTSKNLKLKNLLIVAMSYFFYGRWGRRFFPLIIFSEQVDYFVGLGLQKEQRQGRTKILHWGLLNKESTQ